MAIARTGTSRFTAASGTTASVTRPAGASTGDLLILAIANEVGAGIAAPGGAGWNTLFSLDAPAGIRSYAVFWRIDDGAAGPWVFTWGGANDFRWWRCVAYSGTDTSDPISASGHQENASSVNMDAPSITPTDDNCLLLFFGNPDGATGSMSTDPAGMTEFDAVANCVYAAEQQLGAAAATGTRTGVLNTATENQGVLIAIAPAPARPKTLAALGVG